jgi:hypothetical protein
MSRSFASCLGDSQCHSGWGSFCTKDTRLSVAVGVVFVFSMLVVFVFSMLVVFVFPMLWFAGSALTVDVLTRQMEGAAGTGLA